MAAVVPVALYTPPQARSRLGEWFGATIYHGVGSNAMGPSDDDVVDSRLRVREVSGLRVTYASVLPGQVSGNTAAPAMAIGWRGADFVLDDN